MFNRILCGFALLAISFRCFSAADERNVTLNIDRFNFSVSYFKGEWHRSPNKLIAVMLQSEEGRAMAVRADETPLSLDGMVNAQKIEDNSEREGIQQISQSETMVAGEKAVLLRSFVKNGPVNLLRSITVFTHQGDRLPDRRRDG